MIDIPILPLKKDYIYKETSAKKLELTFLKPLVEKYDKAPVLFMIPGGGWHSETRQSMIDFSPIVVGKLRNEGFAVVAIDYRVTGDGAKMTDILTDCFDAARYMAKYEDVFGVDKNNFVTIGHSAGGHLALMIAYAPQDKFKDDLSMSECFEVKVAVGLSPVAVIHDRSFHILNNLADLYNDENDIEEIGETEPISYVSKTCPPTILLTGTHDDIIYPKSSEVLYEKLRVANINTKLLYSNGGTHDYKPADDDTVPTPSYEENQEECVKFVLEALR